jgi:hypothetical protein
VLRDCIAVNRLTAPAMARDGADARSINSTMSLEVRVAT